MTSERAKKENRGPSPLMRAHVTVLFPKHLLLTV